MLLNYNAYFSVKDSTNQISATTTHIMSTTGKVVMSNLKTTVVRIMPTSSHRLTKNPITSRITMNPISPVTTVSQVTSKVTSDKFRVITTVGLVATTVAMETISPQMTSQSQVDPLSMTLISPTRHPSRIPTPLSTDMTTDTNVFVGTDVSASSSSWLPQTMGRVVKTETIHLQPSRTPTDKNNSAPTADQVMLVYPPKNETIKVTVTQSDVSTMLNCTVAGSNLTDINMLWTYNKRLLTNNSTELLNNRKVSYVLAEIPGVYQCIVQSSTNGVMSSRIAGVFEVIMLGKI